MVRVTILEDHALMRASMAEVLSGAGFEVIGQYWNAEVFLSRLAEERPSIAIVDLGVQDARGFPIADGLSLVGEILRRAPEARVVVFSGGTDPETVDACCRLGVAAYLDKLTTDGPRLVGALEAVAQGERFFPACLMSSPLSALSAHPASKELDRISSREKEVLRHIAAGADNLKIASLLGITERTVKAHVSSLYRKLMVENRTQLALTALRLGLRPPTPL